MDFNGNKTVQGPNESFSANCQRALNNTWQWIRVLSSETIAHLKKNKKQSLS